MKAILRMLKKDDNAYSIGRICAIVSFIVFICISIYLAIKSNGKWDGYLTFATCTMGYVCVQLANKAVDFLGVKISEKKEDKNETK